MHHLATPLYLLLLVPLAIGFLLRWFSRPAAIAVSSTKHFTGKSKTSRGWLTTRHIAITLEVIAAALIIFCLARPQKGIEIIAETKEGTDIMLVLDMSTSMDFYDPERGMSKAKAARAMRENNLKDRLTVAKEKLVDFIKRRPNDRIGLAVFGSSSHTGCPPTLDHNFLIGQIDMLSGKTFPSRQRATNIASGLTAGINTLLDESDSRRTIVLITDGENSVVDDVTPLEAASIARVKGIVVHAIAVGSGNAISESGRHRVTGNNFDTSTLKGIAKIAKGKFFQAKSAEGFEEVMNTIDQLEKRSHTKPALIFQQDQYPPYLILAAIILILSLLARYVVFPEIS